MRRHKQSSVRLAFFEEQLDDVDLQPQRLRKRYLVGAWCAWWRLADSERSPFADGHNLSDGRLPIQDCDRFASPHSAQVFAQSSLQFRDPHSLHSHILTRSGDCVKDKRSNTRSNLECGDLSPLLVTYSTIEGKSTSASRLHKVTKSGDKSPHSKLLPSVFLLRNS